MKNNMFGITNIRVKTIEVNKDDVSEVNEFLEKYNGNIIDIQVIPMLYGLSRFVIAYKYPVTREPESEVVK